MPAMQQVSVRTVPDGAACSVARGGTPLGAVDPTPGSLAVGHSRTDLTVTCRKPGWIPATGTVAAKYQGVGVRQLLNGGIASIVEDAATSSDFSYDPAGVTVTLGRRAE